MPQVMIFAVEGRTAEQKKQLCLEITESVSRCFNSPPSAVTVQIIESPPEAKSSGGVMFSER